MEREAGWDDAAVDSDDSTGGADADIAAALESHAAATRVQHRIEPYLEIGKQLLMTRGSLTTFSIANDVAKYFAIIPAMLMVTFPAIAPLNIMRLQSPNSAILSAIIFNALVIVALIPLALRGVAYKPVGALALLQRNLLVYGLGGILVPFAGIKAIDVLITTLHLA